MRDHVEEVKLLRQGSAYDLYKYAVNVAKCRIPEFEERLAQVDATGWHTYLYAREIAGCRVPVFERRLRKYGVLYVNDIPI